jgi:hypothetical protein
MQQASDQWQKNIATLRNIWFSSTGRDGIIYESRAASPSTPHFHGSQAVTSLQLPCGCATLLRVCTVLGFPKFCNSLGRTIGGRRWWVGGPSHAFCRVLCQPLGKNCVGFERTRQGGAGDDWFTGRPLPPAGILISSPSLSFPLMTYALSSLSPKSTPILT